MNNLALLTFSRFFSLAAIKRLSLVRDRQKKQTKQSTSSGNSECPNSTDHVTVTPPGGSAHLQEQGKLYNFGDASHPGSCTHHSTNFECRFDVLIAAVEEFGRVE